MQIPNKRYTCRWCGFTSTNIDDFELDFKNNQGFWCGDCDGFTFLMRRRIRSIECSCC